MTTSNSRPLGHIVWHELMTADIPAARKFYSDLLGWRIDDENLIHAGDPHIARIQQARPGEPGRWIPYLEVPDPDAMAERAVAAGATLTVPATDIPGVAAVSPRSRMPKAPPSGSGRCGRTRRSRRPLAGSGGTSSSPATRGHRGISTPRPSAGHPWTKRVPRPDPIRYSWRVRSPWPASIPARSPRTALPDPTGSPFSGSRIAAPPPPGPSPWAVQSTSRRPTRRASESWPSSATRAGRPSY